MSIDNYNDTFGKDADYFTGYFSDKALDDLDDSFIYSTMGPSDYSKLSDQMNDSMGRLTIDKVYKVVAGTIHEISFPYYLRHRYLPAL